MQLFNLFIFFTIFIISLGLSMSVPLKIDQHLQNFLSNNDGHAVQDILISVQDGDTLPVLKRLKKTRGSENISHIERSTSVYRALTQHAQVTQKPVVEFLNQHDVEFESLWIINQIFIKGANGELIKRLAELPQVEKIELDQEFIIDEEDLEEEKPDKDFVGVNNISSSKYYEGWNIKKIEADKAWALPGVFAGEGIITGMIDSGVNANHRLLKNKFVHPEFCWYDGVNGYKEPYDGSGHGTHVLGIMVAGEGLGVSPNSKWVVCKGTGTKEKGDRGEIYHFFTKSGTAKCGFMVCPSRPDGSDKNCNLTPHVINHSFGKGGKHKYYYKGIIETYHAVGIIPVFASGNSGPGCGTGGYPGSEPDAIGVGGTDIDDTVYSKSGRGPIEGILKPDFSAPGRKIWSTDFENDEGVTRKTGTSMSAPAVTGLVAMMLGVNPKLTYQDVYEILMESANRDLSFEGEECGGTLESDFPNNIFGWGRIDAFKAVQIVLGTI